MIHVARDLEVEQAPLELARRTEILVNDLAEEIRISKEREERRVRDEARQKQKLTSTSRSRQQYEENLRRLEMSEVEEDRQRWTRMVTAQRERSTELLSAHVERFSESLIGAAKAIRSTAYFAQNVRIAVAKAFVKGGDARSEHDGASYPSE